MASAISVSPWITSRDSRRWVCFFENLAAKVEVVQNWYVAQELNVTFHVSDPSADSQ